MPSRDANSGLPDSKPMRYYLSHAAPYPEPRRILTDPRRTLGFHFGFPHGLFPVLLLASLYALLPGLLLVCSMVCSMDCFIVSSWICSIVCYNGCSMYCVWFPHLFTSDFLHGCLSMILYSMVCIHCCFPPWFAVWFAPWSYSMLNALICSMDYFKGCSECSLGFSIVYFLHVLRLICHMFCSILNFMVRDLVSSVDAFIVDSLLCLVSYGLLHSWLLFFSMVYSMVCSIM